MYCSTALYELQTIMITNAAPAAPPSSLVAVAMTSLLLLPLILYQLTDVTHGLRLPVHPDPGGLDDSEPLHLVHQVDQPHRLVLLLLLTHSLQ